MSKRSKSRKGLAKKAKPFSVKEGSLGISVVWRQSCLSVVAESFCVQVLFCRRCSPGGLQPAVITSALAPYTVMNVIAVVPVSHILVLVSYTSCIS